MRLPYLKFRGRLLPIVSIWMKGLQEGVEFKALVDSGAAYSVFQAEMAEILDLRLEQGKENYVCVGDGSMIKVYLHRIPVKLAGQEFEALIGFSRRLGIGFNIIGRLDIFDSFKICFDESEAIVEFFPKLRGNDTQLGGIANC
jgi:predicted aspartyl protease